MFVQFKCSLGSFYKVPQIFNSNSKKKNFNFFLLMVFISIFTKLYIFTKKIQKKKFIILKSPFHFKLFKHILTYRWYNIFLYFLVYNKLKNTIVHLLKQFIFLIKIYKIVCILNYNFEQKRLSQIF